MIKRSSLNIFAAIYLTVLIVLLSWFFSGGATLKIESPLRMVLGALFIFIMPGIIWGEVLKFRSSHILETIALSFAITLAIEVFLLPIPFLFASTIKLWIISIFIICIAGIAIFVIKSKKEERPTFIQPLFTFLKQAFPLNISTALILTMLITISAGTYRWGEHLTDISGEKMLHVSFVRYYYSMPMVLRDLGIYKGMPPSNLINLWEYLIAGWACVIHMDPLPLFYHARFIIPFLGFSSMYLLIKNIFSDLIKTEAIFWSVLIMSIGGFILLSPSNLDWVKGDPYRLVTSFMGTVHHSDSAMDIMLALGTALLLMTIRNCNKKSILLLLGVLSALFMWHTREFFQVAVYAGIVGLVMLVIPHADKNKFRNWLVAASVFVVILIVFLPIIKSVLSHQAQGYDELSIKKAALKYSFSKENFLGVRNLFNFPLHATLSSSAYPDMILDKKSMLDTFKGEWNYSLWLILSALSIPFLALWGGRQDRRLALFYIFLWFLALCWNFSALLLIFFTYSEILFSTPRFIYLFSYITIGAAFSILYGKYRQKISRNISLIAYAASMLLSGFILKIWWDKGFPAAKDISVMLTAIVFISLIYVIITRKRRESIFNYKATFLMPAVFGFLLFIYPVIGKDINSNVTKIVKGRRSNINWFSSDNPFGFSRSLIQYLSTMPQQKSILVYPLGTDLVSAYAPQYMAVVPEVIGTVINEHNTYLVVRSGKHPLFNFENFGMERSSKSSTAIKTPDFDGLFSEWKSEADILNLRHLSRNAPPLMNLGNRGGFNFRRSKESGSDVITILPSSDGQIGRKELQLGYALGKNGLNLKVIPGDEVVFTLSARLSGILKVPATIFIQDKAGTWRRNSVVIDKMSWDQYFVSKKIRDGVTEVNIGVHWITDDDNDRLEIKDARIYILTPDEISEIKKDTKLSENDHIAVKDILNRYKVDYILIDKEYYAILKPYFTRFPEDYDITFDNLSGKELVVRYRGEK